MTTSEVATPESVASSTLHLPEGDSTLAAVVRSPGEQEQIGVLEPSGGVGSPNAQTLSLSISEQVGVLEPSGGIDLYHITVGQKTDSLRFDLAWATLPEGVSGRLLVFNAEGQLLIDQPQVATANSTTLVLNGPVRMSDSALYVGVQIREPAVASDSAGAITYSLRITEPNPPTTTGSDTNGSSSDSEAPVDQGSSDPVLPTSAGPVVSAQGPSFAPVPSVGPVGVTSTTVASAHYLLFPPTVPTSAGPVVSAQGPSFASVPSVGPVGVTSTTTGGRDAPGSPSPPTPIDVRPLPTSPHEPAGGIFSDGRPAERVARLEETRLEMSLVRLMSPGRPGPRGNLDSGMTPPREIALLGGSPSSDEPRLFRPGGQPFPVATFPPTWSEVRLALAVLAPLANDSPVEVVPRVSAATLPPIDGSDRPKLATPTTRWDEATGDEEPPGRESDPVGAILLGLSGSAALSIGLYAPDLTTAVRRAVPRPVPNPPPRPASRRDERAPE